jgi:putative addiction module killer protein
VLIVKRTNLFEKWYEKIKDGVALAAIGYRVRKLSFGVFGDSKQISKNLYELRIHVHGGIRIYYTRQGSEIILLLAGNKTTQKRDIAKAMNLLKES